MRMKTHVAIAQPARKLVSVTRMAKQGATARTRTHSAAPPTRWIFQDAKARLSEVVRRARSEGPQHVTVHGRPGVVVVAEEEFRRMKGTVTGAALINAMQACPFPEVALIVDRTPMPVRKIDLT